MKVLFVCTGNTCRSPFAEALARRLAEGTAHEFASAGFHALAGAPCPPEAVDAAREHGVDLSPHRSRQLTRELEEDADLMVDLRHLPDPFGRGPAAYRESYELIRLEVFGVLAEDEPR